MSSFPSLRLPWRLSHWWIVIPAWLAGWLFLAGRCEITPFSGDESGWISSSLETTRQMTHGGWVDFKQWEPPPAGPWGSLNPPLGKWMIGIPLSVYCWSQGTWFDRYYDFWATGSENIRRGNIPPPDILLAARRIVAFYGSLLILAVVWLGCRLRTPWVGLAAGGAILLDPLFQTVGTMALTDALYGLGLVLVAASLCRAPSPPPGDGNPRRYLLSGWLTGMLGLIKISGWAPVWLGMQVPLLLRGWRRRAIAHSVVPPALVFGAGFGMAVYVLTPFLWPLEAPPGPARIDTARAGIGLVSEFPPSSSAGAPVVVRLPGDIARGMIRFPELMVRWRRFSLYQASLGLGPWEPNRVVAFVRELGGTPLRALAMCLALGMCLGMLRRLMRKDGSPPEGEDPLGPIWGCFFLVGLMLQPLNIDRYYLPILLLGYFLAVLALHDGLQRLHRCFLQNSEG